MCRMSDIGFVAFGYVAFGCVPSGLLPYIVSLWCWPYVPHGWYLGLESSGSWILVCTVLSSSKFYDVSLICIFPWYRPSVLVFLSRMEYSVYLVELVYLIGICCLPIGLFWDICILCFYMLPMIWGLFYMIHLLLMIVLSPLEIFIILYDLAGLLLFSLSNWFVI